MIWLNFKTAPGQLHVKPQSQEMINKTSILPKDLDVLVNRTDEALFHIDYNCKLFLFTAKAEAGKVLNPCQIHPWRSELEGHKKHLSLNFTFCNKPVHAHGKKI